MYIKRPILLAPTLAALLCPDSIHSPDIRQPFSPDSIHSTLDTFADIRQTVTRIWHIRTSNSPFRRIWGEWPLLSNMSLLPESIRKMSTYADVGFTCLAHAESRISGLEVEVIGAELSGENEKQVFNASFFSNIGLIVSAAGSFDQRRFFINFLQSCCLMKTMS